VVIFFFIDQQEKNQQFSSSLNDFSHLSEKALILAQYGFDQSEFNTTQIQKLATASAALHRTLYTLVPVVATRLGFSIKDDLEDMKISYEALRTVNAKETMPDN
jgi:hypothetical protein